MSRPAPNTGCVPAHRVAPANRSIMTSTNSRGKAAFVLPSNKRLPEIRSNSSASSTKSMAVMQSSLSSPSDAYRSPLYNTYMKSGHSRCSKQTSSRSIRPQGSMITMTGNGAKGQRVECTYGNTDNRKVRQCNVSFSNQYWLSILL